MKKIISILLLMFIITSVKAECDYKKEVELNKLASMITYQIVYNEENNTFDIKLFNINEQLFISYKSDAFIPDTNGQTIIKNIKEGLYITLTINTNESHCYSSLMSIYITIPYYNEMYGNDRCIGYENKLAICTDKFLSYDTDEVMLNNAINNLNNKFEKEEIEEVIVEESITLKDKVINFIKEWGIKIGLVFITIIITISIFQIKLRKIKHGI